MPANPILAAKPRVADPFVLAVGDYLLTLASERKSPKTVRSMSDVLNRFRAFAGPIDPADIDARLLRRWLASLNEEGLSGTTQAGYLTRLKTFLRWLEREDDYGVDTSFLRKIKAPRLDTEQPDPFSTEDIVALLGACKTTTWTGIRMRAVIALLLDTGVRASELCGLRLDDVDLEKGEIYVRAETSKSRRSRTIVLGARARREQGRWWRVKRGEWDDSPESFWFMGWNQKGVDDRTLHRLVTRHGTRCGVPNANPHRFRHTAAFLAACASMSPMGIMQMLGHSDLRMTMRYIKLAERQTSVEKRDKSPLDQIKLR